MVAELRSSRPHLPADVDVRARQGAGAAELGSFVADFAHSGRLEWDEQMLSLHSRVISDRPPAT